MKQLNINYDLEWLDPEWVPEKVTHITNSKRSEREIFDDLQAQSWGYENHQDMITKMNKKHKHHKLAYGDAYLRGDII